MTLRWWSPWNEPNGTFFVSPQRAACDRSSPPVSPAVYTKLDRAMRAELEQLPGEQKLVVGELAGLARPRLRGSGVKEFYARCPDDVVCTARCTRSTRTPSAAGRESALRPVEQLEAALDKRPCAKDKPIWVTETGVGGHDVGGDRDRRPRDAASRLPRARRRAAPLGRRPARRGRVPVHVPRRPGVPGRPRRRRPDPYLAGLRRVARLGR